MSLKSQIQQVLKDKSVLDYLSKRGHSPVDTLAAGKYRFLCPLDGHDESRPSFFVYTQAEYENWYCFGCARGGSIINLVSYLEHLSFKDALEKLSDGISVSAEDDIKFILERIKKDSLQQAEPVSDLAKLLLQASWQCLFYSQGVDFDQNEMDIIDKYYAFLDELTLNTEFEKIEESISHLPIVLEQRKAIFENKEEAKKYTPNE